MIKSFISLHLYLKNPLGATAIEYGLIAAGIALFIAASVYLFGDAVSNILYSDLPQALDGPS